MLLLLMVGIALMLAGLYNLYLMSLARDPSNLSAAVGMLVKASPYKNVPMKNGGVIKIQTDYAYAYRVGGRQYLHRGRVNRNPRTLPRRVTIVYLSRFPRHGGVESFDAFLERSMGTLLLAEGAAMTLLYALIRFSLI